MLFKFLLFLFSIFSYSFSETVILQDGNILKGQLLKQDSNSLIILVKGKTNSISKNKIRRVVYANSAEQEEKVVKEELAKLKQEKDSKIKKTKEEEEQDKKKLDDEISQVLSIQEKLNLSFQDRIKLLEDEIFQLKSNSNLTDASSKISKLEEDVKDLKIRTRRIEKFLSIDPDIEEYYSKPRSIWSIIWRSTLIPGWGLTYARDGFGSLYTTFFIFGGVGYLGVNSSINALEKKYNDKLINDFFIQPAILNQIISNSNFTQTAKNDFNILLLANQNTKYFNMYKLQRDISDQKDTLNSVGNVLAGIYAIQLIHSVIAGYFWSRQNIQKFNETEKTSLKMNFSVDQNLNQNYQIGINHQF